MSYWKFKKESMKEWFAENIELLLENIELLLLFGWFFPMVTGALVIPFSLWVGVGFLVSALCWVLILAIFRLVSSELENYREWKKEHEKTLVDDEMKKQ